jgi:hypothetical protein
MNRGLAIFGPSGQRPTSGAEHVLHHVHDDPSVVADDVEGRTAAIRERAHQALLEACHGWRERRRCTAPDGTRVRNPHPECLAAQYRHEVILLENGIAR